MRRFHCTGLSLIELILGLLFGSILLLSGIYLLQHATQTYRQQQNEIRQLETQRHLDHILNHSIHMTGYFGCHNITHSIIQNNLKNLRLLNPYITHSQHFPAAVIAYHVSSQANLPNFIRQYTKPNSDVLIINYLSATTTTLKNDMENPIDTLSLNQKLLLKKDDRVVINDCTNADIFAISQINLQKTQLWHATSTLNATAQLSKRYLKGSQIGKFIWQMFYIRKTHTTPEKYALFLQDQSGHSEEVINNVENMRLYFTTKNNPQYYLSIAQVSNWQEIKKIKLVLTLLTSKNQLQQLVFIIGLRN